MRKLLLLIGLFPIMLWAQDTPTSGTTGDCTWSYNSSTKTLTISGNGATDGYYKDYTGLDLADRPWHSFCAEIEKVVVEEGVTTLGSQLDRKSVV